MSFLLVLLAFIFILAFPIGTVGLLKPKLLRFMFRKVPSHKLVSLSFVGVIVVSFVLMVTIVSTDKKDFPDTNNTMSANPTPTTVAVKVQSKPTTHIVAIQVKKSTSTDPTNGWSTYVDSSYEYSIKYPKNMYVETIQRNPGGKSDRVNFKYTSNNLSTDDDKEGFSILSVSGSSFADFDHSPQSCKDDGNCTYTKINNSNKIPFGYYDVGNADDDAWIQEANSDIYRYTSINQDLLIWFDKPIDNKTRDSIVNSFQFVTSPESVSAIAQEVKQYGITINPLNNQVVVQSLTIAKDLTAVQEANNSQLQTLIPQVKSDLTTAQATFQQVYDALNTMYVPYDMEASYTYYKKAIYVWIQATKAIQKGVNDNDMNEITAVQSIIQKADDEVKNATDQADNYKTNGE